MTTIANLKERFTPKMIFMLMFLAGTAFSAPAPVSPAPAVPQQPPVLWKAPDAGNEVSITAPAAAGVSSSNTRGAAGNVAFYGGPGGTQTFTVPVGSAFLGTIPNGTYNVVISGAGTSTYGISNGVTYLSQYGSSATFNNVSIQGSTCHITIQ